MPKIEVTLSIGLAGAIREDILEIDDDEWNECTSDYQRNELMQSYWESWSDDYIDGGYELTPS